MTKELIGTSLTDENGVATFTYTGQGRGKMNIVAESGELVSEPIEILDCTILEDEISETKIWNKNINNIDFYMEGIVHPTTNDDSIARILIRESSTNYLNFGDLYGNANCGIQWTYNSVTSSFYGKAIPTDTDTKITLKRTGTNMVLTVGESTINIPNVPLSFNTIERAIITNNSIKNFKVYPI